MSTPFQKDGLIFLHPESKYLHRSNETVFCWKDKAISEYPIDTEEDGKTVSEEVKGVGIIGKDSWLTTLDQHRLAQVQDAAVGECIRFGFRSIGLEDKHEGAMEQ